MRQISTIILIILHGQLWACVCNGTETVKESFTSSQVIFHGRVIEKSIILYSTTLRDEQLKIIRDKFKDDEKRLADLDDKIQKVTFQLIEVFKGDTVTNTMTIFSSIDTSCDIEFKKGKEYIVYGRRWGFNGNKYFKHADNSMDLIKDGLYWTDYCSRTKLFDGQEKKELTELKRE